MRASARKYAAIALKLAATVALFWFVLSRIDLGEMVSRLSGGRILAGLLAGACVVLTQSALAALRLQICAGLLGRSVRGTTAWTACQLGGLFSHTPMSFVGGDAMRAWHLVKSGFTLTEAAKAVLIDRAFGLLGLMALVLATSPGLYLAIEDPGMWHGYLLLVGLGVAGAIGFLALGYVRPLPASGRVLRLLSELVTVSRHLSARPGRSAQAIALAILMNATNGLAVWLISLAYGAGISFYAAMVAAPAVFLVAMVPISVAGWGLREGAFVVAFGLFAVSSADALAVSITFGVAVLFAYSPAVVLFLLARRRGASATKESGYGPASSRPTAHS